MKLKNVLLASGFLMLMYSLQSCESGNKKSNNSEVASAIPEKGLMKEEVEYQLDTLNMKGYIAYNSKFEGKRPGILVVHEWWGHNEHARNRAEMLADLGYTALAVDMYGDGKTADHPEKAGAFAGEVMSNVESAKGRFESAMQVLKDHETVDPDKIGAIGYCFGGGVVLHMARFGYDLDGVVSFHGSLGTQSPAEEGKVIASVLVCHGADDPFVPQEHIDNFKNEMESAGVDYVFEAYEGAKHSFTNPGADANGEKFDLPLEYNKEADEKSWASMRAFFDKVFAD